MRLADLEMETGALRMELHDLAVAHRWLRRRLASFYPERSYCPKCKKLVSPQATHCTHCKHRWAPDPDPDAGLPVGTTR